MNKREHDAWLLKHGLSREQVRQKKKSLGNPNTIPDYSVSGKKNLSNTIPPNGTKSADISKSVFAKKTYATVPAYNKSPIMVVSKSDLIYVSKK